MSDDQDLYRHLEHQEIEALGPMPADETVSPTTDRDSRTPGLTAEVHSPGILQQSLISDADDPFRPPRSLTLED